MSKRRWEQAYKPVQPEAPIELEAPVQEAEEEIVEFVNSPETKSNQGEDMVTRRAMKINCFVPGARPAAQQQLPQGRGQTPPP